MTAATASPGAADTELAGDGEAGSPPGLFRTARALLNRPLTSYYLLLGSTGLLLTLGLAMVLSTSSAIELESGGSPYASFIKQLVGVLLGVAVMLVLSKAPPALFRLAAYPLLLLSAVGLVLVLAIGTTVDGAERWIQVGGSHGITLQPSELAKLAFLLWGADLLARKERLRQLTDFRLLLIPLLPGAAVLGMLVMLGDDLGTTFMLVVILLALLWVIGAPSRMFIGVLGLMVFVLLVLIVVAPYRLHRLTGFVSPAGSPTGPNMQPIQGRYALGSGGLFGVGLGASRAKWTWVSNSSTDFIFAILGEELGLVGTICVLALYGGIGYTGIRIARRVSDTFMRLAAAAATAWIVTQALVNIGAVIGVLPITGVPLPLISQGLSSVLVTLAAIGMLLAFARSEPGARQALACRAGPVRRALSWLGLRRNLAAAPPGSDSPDGPIAAAGKATSKRPAPAARLVAPRTCARPGSVSAGRKPAQPAGARVPGQRPPGQGGADRRAGPAGPGPPRPGR